MDKKRCAWVNLANPLYVRYHDEEWGVPLHDDRRLFELLVLEMMQAGLSWETVLNKRENFRRAFAGFDPQKVASFTEQDVKRLLSNPGIIRNRRKIEAAINNARVYLAIQKEFGSFDRFIWSFVDFKPVDNHVLSSDSLPTTSSLAKQISTELRKRGTTFVGPVIIYSYMQAIGMVNDHEVECFRYREIKNMVEDERIISN